jgi:hypothetical protein
MEASLKKKVGRPCIGKKAKSVLTTIRMTEADKEKIYLKFETVQKFFDSMILKSFKK